MWGSYKLESETQLMNSIFIPGLPTKRANPCVDPQQSKLPHITKVTYLSTDGSKPNKSRWEPNTKDYPEYEYIIKMFIKSEKLNG